jgi:hypothetical protein
MSEPVLKFKYERNVMFELHPDIQFSIPMRQVPKDVDGYTINVPEFDMDKVHELPLLSETPDLPDRDDAFDETHYQSLCRDAYDLASENRKKNEETRKRVYHHVKQGNIKVLDDPFARRKVKLTETSTGLRPSEIAAQMDAEAAEAAPKNKGGRPRKV